MLTKTDGKHTEGNILCDAVDGVFRDPILGPLEEAQVRYGRGSNNDLSRGLDKLGEGGAMLCGRLTRYRFYHALEG